MTANPDGVWVKDMDGEYHFVGTRPDFSWFKDASLYQAVADWYWHGISVDMVDPPCNMRNPRVVRLWDGHGL